MNVFFCSFAKILEQIGRFGEYCMFEGIRFDFCAGCEAQGSTISSTLKVFITVLDVGHRFTSPPPSSIPAAAGQLSMRVSLVQ